MALSLGQMAAGNLSLMSWWNPNSERHTLDVLIETGQSKKPFPLTARRRSETGLLTP